LRIATPKIPGPPIRHAERGASRSDWARPPPFDTIGRANYKEGDSNMSRTSVLMRRATIATLSLVWVAGCDKDATPVEKPAAVVATPPAVLPDGLLLASDPQGAAKVAELKKILKEGDAVVVEGIIGGEEKPFSADQAAFTLLDDAAQTCDTMQAHGCATPWDACCDTELPNRTLRVRLVGADGAAIPGHLEGVAGLKPMRRIVVFGSARKAEGSAGVAVDATHLFVKG
jgi:hypothetical protein